MYAALIVNCAFHAANVMKWNKNKHVWERMADLTEMLNRVRAMYGLKTLAEKQVEEDGDATRTSREKHEKEEDDRL